MISILATIWQSKNPRHFPWYPCRYRYLRDIVGICWHRPPPLRSWTWMKLNASSIPSSLAAKMHALACTWLKCNCSPLNFLIPHVSGKKKHTGYESNSIKQIETHNPSLSSSWAFQYISTTFPASNELKIGVFGLEEGKEIGHAQSILKTGQFLLLRTWKTARWNANGDMVTARSVVDL